MVDSGGVTVCTDEQGGIQQVVDYRTQLGHVHIGMLGGSAHITVTHNRQQAFCAALERLGLPFRDEWVIVDGFSIESGAWAMETLLERPTQPTAVIAINDPGALGILKVARQRHIDVPDTLSLVGLVDVYLSAVSSPERTAVSHNYGVLGSTIIETIINRIQGKTVPASTLIDMELVVRNSCQVSVPRGCHAL